MCNSKFSSFLPPVEAVYHVNKWMIDIYIPVWVLSPVNKKVILIVMREGMFSFFGRSVSNICVHWAAAGKIYYDQIWNNHCIYAYCEISNKAGLKITLGGCLHTLYVEGEDQSRKFCSVVVQNLHGKTVFIFCAIMNNILPQCIFTCAKAEA